MKGQISYTDAGIAEFLNSFYTISDYPGNHDVYAKQFTDDATCIMAGKRYSGSKEILGMRESMWSAVASRDHTVFGVFPSQSNPKEFMLQGSVDYELKNGTKQQVEWAGHAKLVQSADGRWQFEHYQVFLAGGPIAK